MTLPGQVGSLEPTGQRWKNVRACEQCWRKKNSSLCSKTEFCHNYTLCWVIVFIDHTIVASIDVWQSYFAYNCCKYILHCVANSLMSQFTHFLGKLVLAQTLFVSNNCLFPCLPRADTRLLWSGIYSQCSVQCAVYSVQCAVCSMQCVVCSV